MQDANRITLRCPDDVLDQMLREANDLDMLNNRDRYFALAMRGKLGTRNDKGIRQMNGKN